MSVQPHHTVLTRVETGLLAVELIENQQPQFESEVYEEPLHVLALQHSQPFETCQGRYANADFPKPYAPIGRLLFLPANVPLEIKTTSRPGQVTRCLFTSQTLSQFGGDVDISDRGVLAASLNVRQRQMIDIMTRMSDELRTPGLASETLLECLGTALMIQFTRFVQAHANGEADFRGGLSRRQLRIVTEIIETKDKCPSLSELAVHAGLSLRHLTRAFKQTTGVTVYAFIEQVRLEKAKVLLSDTDILMKDIAARLGFSCASSLSVTFRKLTGESPHDYRKRQQRVQSAVAVSG
jgi:AraC family transcriptional regulator